MMEVDAFALDTEAAERVEVAVPDPAEILELDAELERGVSGAHELRFVEAEHLDEGAQVGKRRLADADDADLGRFDEPHLRRMRQLAHQRGRRHPAGGAAAEDHHALSEGGLAHGSCLR